MATVNVHEAKTNLSRLLKRVEAGEEAIIVRNGETVAKLVGVLKRKWGKPPAPGLCRVSVMTPSTGCSSPRHWCMTSFSYPTNPALVHRRRTKFLRKTHSSGRAERLNHVF